MIQKVKKKGYKWRACDINIPTIEIIRPIVPMSNVCIRGWEFNPTLLGSSGCMANIEGYLSNTTNLILTLLHERDDDESINRLVSSKATETHTHKASPGLMPNPSATRHCTRCWNPSHSPSTWLSLKFNTNGSVP
jgi:hypothetical protein